MVRVGALSLLTGSVLHHTLDLNSDGQHGVHGHHLLLLPGVRPLVQCKPLGQ